MSRATRSVGFHTCSSMEDLSPLRRWPEDCLIRRVRAVACVLCGSRGRACPTRLHSAIGAARIAPYGGSVPRRAEPAHVPGHLRRHIPYLFKYGMRFALAQLSQGLPEPAGSGGSSCPMQFPKLDISTEAGHSDSCVARTSLGWPVPSQWGGSACPGAHEALPSILVQVWNGFFRCAAGARSARSGTLAQCPASSRTLRGGMPRGTSRNGAPRGA